MRMLDKKTIEVMAASNDLTPLRLFFESVGGEAKLFHAQTLLEHMYYIINKIASDVPVNLTLKQIESKIWDSAYIYTDADYQLIKNIAL